MQPDHPQPPPLTHRLSRRSFLGQCSAAAGKVASSAVAAPLVIQAELEAALPRNKLAVGLIGVGQHGLKWAQSITESPDIKLSAWFDPDPAQIDKASSLLRKKNITPPKFASIENEIFDCAHIDALIIASPSQFHFRHISQAIHAGKHVVAEKPLGMNQEELAEIENLLAKNEKIALLTAWTRRYFEPRKDLIQWLKTTQPGKMIEMQVCWNQPQGPQQGHGGWMLDRAAMGDWLAEHGDHIWDLLLEIRPDSVPSVVKSIRSGHLDRPSRYFSVVLDWPDGCIAHVRHNMIGSSGFQSPGLSFNIQFENALVDLITGRIASAAKFNNQSFEFKCERNEMQSILGELLARIQRPSHLISMDNQAEIERSRQILDLRNNIVSQMINI
jgi:predicted dehydrogenase